MGFRNGSSESTTNTTDTGICSLLCDYGNPVITVAAFGACAGSAVASFVAGDEEGEEREDDEEDERSEEDEEDEMNVEDDEDGTMITAFIQPEFVCPVSMLAMVAGTIVLDPETCPEMCTNLTGPASSSNTSRLDSGPAQALYDLTGVY